MTIDCAGSEILSLWMQRYPEMTFLCTYGGITPYELDEPIGPVDFPQVDLLYVFGLGHGQYYEALTPWLHEKQERMVIFLEDDLGLVATLSQRESTRALISDPQVHIELLGDPKALSSQLNVLVFSFPSNAIDVIALPSYSQTRAALFKKIRMTLLRASALSDATLTESLYAHYLVGNILANIRQWPRSFFANGLKNKFANVPAVICGAGPSLGASLPLLKTLGERALIIAGGSTIAALSNQGIIPHLGLAFDPNAEEYERLRVSSAFEMPLIYGTRLQPDVLSTCNGPLGYLHSHTGGPCEAYCEQALGVVGEPIGPELGPEALSVTTMALALAVEMGCNPILLTGIDLAYTGMERYAAGVMPTSKVELSDISKPRRALERMLRRKGIQGTMVHTLVKWVMESNCISTYAKQHPEAHIMNVAEAGLGFKEIPNCSFSQVVQEHCQTERDLSSWVHAEIQQLKMTQITQPHVAELLSDLNVSLSALSLLSTQMLEELNTLDPATRTFPTGMMTLLEMEIEEEKAFHCFFPHINHPLERILNRSHPLPLETESIEYKQRLLDHLIAKWKQINSMIDAEIEMIKLVL